MDYAKIRREYERAPLTLETLEADPIKEFHRWFELAYGVYGDDCNAMTLATADMDGNPSARTVLLKGVTGDGFLFFTNYRSRKGKEIEENPKAAILFYWGVLDRQIRIEGSVRKVSKELSDEYFESRPLGSRISAIISPQSTPITIEELQTRREELERSDIIRRPEHWGGYELTADYFEFWNGQENRFHDRFVYKKLQDGKFDLFRIAP